MSYTAEFVGQRESARMRRTLNILIGPVYVTSQLRDAVSEIQCMCIKGHSK